MYRHILLPTNGSRLSEQAVDAGIRLARKVGARVTGIHVMPLPPSSPLEAWAHNDREFREHVGKSFETRAVLFLEAVRDAARRAGVPCECHIVQGEAAHAEIIKAAQAHDCDLIVMGCHAHGTVAEDLRESEALKVLANGSVPVLVHY